MNIKLPKYLADLRVQLCALFAVALFTVTYFVAFAVTPEYRQCVARATEEFYSTVNKEYEEYSMSVQRLFSSYGKVASRSMLLSTVNEQQSIIERAREHYYTQFDKAKLAYTSSYKQARQVYGVAIGQCENADGSSHGSAEDPRVAAMYECDSITNTTQKSECVAAMERFTQKQQECTDLIDQRADLFTTVTANCPAAPQDAHGCLQDYVNNTTIRSLYIPGGEYFISAPLVISRSNLIIRGSVSSSNPTVFSNNPNYQSVESKATQSLLSVTHSSEAVDIANIRLNFAYQLGFEHDEDILWNGVATFRGKNAEYCGLELVGPVGGKGVMNTAKIQEPAENLTFTAVAAAYSLDTRPDITAAYAWHLVGQSQYDANGNRILELNGPRNIVLDNVIGGRSAKEGLKIDVGGAPNLKVVGGRYHNNAGDGLDIVGLQNSQALFDGILIDNNGYSAVECKNAGVGIPDGITFKNLTMINNPSAGIVLRQCKNVQITNSYIENSGVGLQNNPSENTTINGVIVADTNASTAVGLRVYPQTKNLQVDNLVLLHSSKQPNSYNAFIEADHDVYLGTMISAPLTTDSVQTLQGIEVRDNQGVVYFSKPYYADSASYEDRCLGQCERMFTNRMAITPAQRQFITNWQEGIINWRELQSILFAE